MGSWLVWDPVPKNGSIASLEQDAHSAPQVGGSFPLILASVAGKSRSQLLHLPLGIWVPSPKGLYHHWQESNPLPPTLFLCPINFALIGIGEGMAILYTNLTMWIHLLMWGSRPRKYKYE